MVNGAIRAESSNSSKSAESGQGELVDLVIEDVEAEETERVRARKEGGAEWNVEEPKNFVYVPFIHA